MLWKRLIPSEWKIQELEQGLEPEVIETVRDPIEIQNVGDTLIGGGKARNIDIVFYSVEHFIARTKLEELML